MNMKDDSQFIRANIDDKKLIEDDFYSDDEFPVYDFMTIQFDFYDLSSALGELRSDFGLSFEGTFSIQEGDVIKTYDDLGNEV